MYEYRARLKRIVDGDTVDFDVQLGFGVNISIRTRLVGVNTPERGQANYKEAGQKLESLIRENMDEEGYNVIRTQKTGKYGRWLAEIDGNVNQEMASIWSY